MGGSESKILYDYIILTLRNYEAIFLSFFFGLNKESDISALR